MLHRLQLHLVGKRSLTGKDIFPLQIAVHHKEMCIRDREIQHRYGSYENVLLSDTEYGKLRQEFPGDYQMRVERLSEYMASTGRSYKNHLATIRSWAKREKPKYNPADYTFEEGDSL